MAVLATLRDELMGSYSRVLLAFVASAILYWLLPTLYGLFISPTRNIPGPFWARVTALNELRMLLRGDSNIEYSKLHEKYGSVVRMGPNRYSFSDPADVKLIYELGEKFTKTTFYNPLNHPDPELRNIFTLLDPAKHKERRKKVASFYSMTTMLAYEDTMRQKNDVCIRKMKEFAQTGQSFALMPFMQYYAFDVIGAITFNTDFGMMESNKDPTGMVYAVHANLDYLAHVGLVPNLHPWIRMIQKALGQETVLDLMMRYIVEQFAQHREANAKKTDKPYDTFLKKVLDVPNTSEMEVAQMTIDSCGSNVTAGSGTSGITLSSAIYHLYTHPEVVAKLRHEIDTMAAEGKISDPVTFSQAQEMPYLQAVIKESLRMHPAIGSILPREVPKGGAQLAGTYFPEGTNVGANAWVLHFSKEIFGPDAREYRPERWLEGKKEGDIRHSMMFGFGGGSRTCIGKNISILEMNKIIPQIVRNLDFEFDGPMKMRCAWFVTPQITARTKLRGAA